MIRDRLMMNVVTRKSDVKEYLDRCLEIYSSDGVEECAAEIDRQLLSKKVRFPLLEFCGKRLYEEVDDGDHIELCDLIERLKREGGNVLLGVLLQCRLKEYYVQSIEKGVEYIAKADAWYVCDIIGERLFGYSLLHYGTATIPMAQTLVSHESNWVVRSIGAGIHYAVKKGLSPENAKSLFKMLLRRANETDKEIRQGIGWAAKTTAKFHPEIIEAFHDDIYGEGNTANWFRKKIEIGLQRNRYAKGNRS